MKNIIVIIFLATIMAIMASCEKEVELKVPQHEPALTINSNTETNERITVHIGRSAGVLQHKQNQSLQINNALVKLSVDGKEEVLLYDAVEGTYKSNTVAGHGKTYKLNASAPGFKNAEASSTVPEFVAISDIQRFEKVRVNADGITQDEIRIKFKDPATKGDFYIVKFISSFPDSGYVHSEFSVCVNTTDPSVESIYNETIDQNTCIESNGIFLRDNFFNGQTKELRLFVDNYYTQANTRAGTMHHPVIELYHVSEAHFRFAKSYLYATANRQNPFAEPVNIYSNVTNGYGIFSVVSLDAKEIK